MNIIHRIFRRLYRIGLMPAFVMGLDAPQQIVSSSLWEKQPLAD